jgi:hypothetical protein
MHLATTHRTSDSRDSQIPLTPSTKSVVSTTPYRYQDAQQILLEDRRFKYLSHCNDPPSSNEAQVLLASQMVPRVDRYSRGYSTTGVLEVRQAFRREGTGTGTD